MKEKKQTIEKTSKSKNTKSTTTNATKKSKVSTVEKKTKARSASTSIKSATAKQQPSKTLKKIITELPFQIDSFVFYPNEGVGQIIDIEERTFDNETVPYYVIKFVSQKMISRIPTKNIKILRIRKVISKNYVQKIWKTLEEVNSISELPWKDRLLKHQEVLKKGNALETAEMLTSLYIRGLERQLSFQERQYYDFAFDSLRDELSIVLNLDSIQTSQSIKKSLKKSQEKQPSRANTSPSE